MTASHGQQFNQKKGEIGEKGREVETENEIISFQTIEQNLFKSHTAKSIGQLST